ncbi:MAG: redoxin protein [Sphingobacteriaceae bacterium]|jgi:protein SCO1/2|nr:redoxin protein [Sphingobacteriaceae bacterium]
MKNNFSVKKILILATILVLPGFLYYLLKEKGKNRYRPLQIYGAKKATGTFHTYRGKQIPDTIYHLVDSFKLVNQLGNTVAFPADTQKITIVNFFFTRCPTFCQNMNGEMARVVDEYQKNRLLKFLSISVDPDYDTPDVLRKYSEQYYPAPGKWDFLTGDKATIYRLSRQSFLVDALKDTAQQNNIIHSPMLILVDPQRRIRGFYDSGRKDQVDKLIDEVKVLIAEELRHVKNVGF